MTTKATASKVRAYPLTQHANEGKLALVHDLLQPWQTALGHMQTKVHRMILNGEGLQKRISLKPSDLSFETELSSRQVDSVHTQVYGALSSWQGQLKNAVRETITGSTLDDETRTILYRVNSWCAWYAKELTLPMSVNKTTGEVKHGRATGKNWDIADDLIVPQEALRLMRHIAKRCTRKHASLPNLARVRSMGMDKKIAQLERAKEGNSFDWWVRVSTLENGKPVRIPLRGNKYFNEAAGEVGRFVQISLKNDDSIQFTLQKKAQVSDQRPDTGTWLGLDFGMKALFATSDGRLLGHGALPHLKELDEQSQALQKALQKQGISRKTNKRYQALQHRMRAYIKNEVNRLLNSLARDDISGLVVENLDFRGGGLSRTTNRLLTRLGRGAIKDKLKSLTEDYGVAVVEVNSAYTSQQCSSCDYVNAKNRSTRDNFHCRFCGNKLHADVNGARTVLSRRSWLTQVGSNTRSKRGTVRERLDSEFMTRWGCSLPTNHATSKARSAPLTNAV